MKMSEPIRKAASKRITAKMVVEGQITNMKRGKVKGRNNYPRSIKSHYNPKKETKELSSYLRKYPMDS